MISGFLFLKLKLRGHRFFIFDSIMLAFILGITIVLLNKLYFHLQWYPANNFIVSILIFWGPSFLSSFKIYNLLCKKYSIPYSLG